MALTVNTNMSSLIVQNNLDAATKALNASIQRMTTGYKINSAGDDAAGYAVATKMDTRLSATTVAQSNVQIGQSLLATAESNYDLIIAHLQRIRDLAEQGANGTYGADSLAAMQAEVQARFDEIDRIAGSTEFNGINLLDGSVGTNGINLQVGTESDANSQITLSQTLFKEATSADLLGAAVNTVTGKFATGTAAGDWLTTIGTLDTALGKVTTIQTQIGAIQNRLDSAGQALTVKFDNLTSSLSTIKDADVAAESSNFIKAQILQQASATLLSTANQTPSIALNLI